jgi:RES domain
MSSNIWTLDELSSNARSDRGTCWRVVEAQHYISTAKLTDTADEQNRLEAIIESSKPIIPEECRHLHYLLFTPFRYGAPYPRGSRFRRPGFSPGVFYGSILSRTAATELAFSRLLFYAESPATKWPSEAAELSAFSVDYAVGRAIDLTHRPFSKHMTLWTDPIDYSHCQKLADGARETGIDLIRYQSARDPNLGTNLAILRCRAFASNESTGRETWHIQLSPSGVRIICEFPRAVFSFDRKTFASDPRIAKLDWDR